MPEKNLSHTKRISQIISKILVHGKVNYDFGLCMDFVSSTDTDEEQVMYSYSDNIAIMINNKTDELIEYIFE